MTAMPARFTIEAMADVQLLQRLLGHFSQRGLIPSAVQAGMTGERMTVSLEYPDIATGTAEIIAARMRASVMVEHVDLSIEAGAAEC